MPLLIVVLITTYFISTLYRVLQNPCNRVEVFPYMEVISTCSFKLQRHTVFTVLAIKFKFELLKVVGAGNYCITTNHITSIHRC